MCGFALVFFISLNFTDAIFNFRIVREIDPVDPPYVVDGQLPKRRVPLGIFKNNSGKNIYIVAAGPAICSDIICEFPPNGSGIFAWTTTDLPKFVKKSKDRNGFDCVIMTSDDGWNTVQHATFSYEALISRTLLFDGYTFSLQEGI